jgi:hypothetical protein
MPLYRWLAAGLAAIPMMSNMLRPAPPSLYWWTTGVLQKVRPYDSPPEKLKNPVQFAAARIEFESFQIVFRGDSQDLDGLDVDVSDFKSADTAVLANKNVTVYFESYLDLPQLVTSAYTDERQLEKLAAVRMEMGGELSSGQ